MSSDEQLLVKTKIVCDNKNVNTDEMYNYIQQKPNRRLFGIRMHLRTYYVFEKSTRKFGTWFRETVGEQPVIYDKQANDKTIEQLQLYMQEKGYYNAKATTQIKHKGIHDKKIQVNYIINSGKLYTISSISYAITDSSLAKIVEKNHERSIIKKEKVFDLTNLQQEQQRLTRIINDLGYYAFNEKNIYFAADTTLGSDSVKITIGIKPNNSSNYNYNKQYRIRNTYIYPDFKPNEIFNENKKTLDTLRYSNSIYYLCSDSSFINPNVIQRANFIFNDSLYYYSSVEKTQRQLSQNKLFKVVTISFEEQSLIDTSSKIIDLDCYIHITPFTRQALTFEIEGTNTSGDWGAEINSTYIHKNLFHGAENLKIKLKAAGEYNNALKTSNESYQLFNSQEYGTEINLETPVFLSPIKPEKFDLNYKPKTIFQIGYNFMKTPDYTRPTSHINVGYVWYGNNYLTHTFRPIDISYIRYYNPSERFTKFLESRDYYKYSYEDYLIYSMNYSYVFYNKNPKSTRNYQYFKYYLESAGNIMSLYNIATNKQRNTDGSFETFNVVFAQYIKNEIDYRFYKSYNKETKLVYRLFGGLAIPLKNSDALPSVKKYFSGGANSMRAWQNRTLGPGAYVDSSASAFKYYVGDIKLEANIEARFHMFWLIDGAAFIDIGNIWSFKDNELKGGEFFSSKFLNELAIGTGYGLRFDFSFFVFRADLGVKMREPYKIKNTNSHIIWGNRPINSEDFNLNIGIGYPF